MQMTLEFDQQLQYQNYVDVEEIGQFALEASNDEGMYWYIVVRTIMGTTTIATCGPVVPDIDILPNGFSTTLTKMPYKEDKLGKTIGFWLNDKSKKLTTARVLDIEEAINQFRDLKDYLINFRDDTL